MKSKNTTPIYDRKRSGFVRSFKSFDVFLFNIMGFSLGLALCTNPSFIGGFAPNSNIIGVVVLGAILALINGLNYGWFSAIMPSTGGDYIFVSRGINPSVGFLTNWGFTLCQLYGLAGNIIWILTMAFFPAFATSGQLLNDDSLLSLASTISNHYVLVGAIVIALIYWLISLFGLNSNKKFMIGVFLIGICGPILIAWVFYSNTHGDFVNAFNTFMNNPNAYQIAITTIQEQGITIEAQSVFSDTFKALPLGFLCFMGFTYSVYCGGEVSKPEKNQIRGIMFALFIGILTFLICMGKYVDIVGQEFHVAIGNPTVLKALGLQTFPVNFVAGILIKNPVLNILMHIGIIVWFLLVPYIMFQVCTRNLIAWTCDGLFPTWILKRTKNNAPWVASFIVCFAVILIITIIHFTRISLVGAVALASVAFLFSGISACLLKYSDPNTFVKLPKIAKTNFLGIIPLFTIVGLLCVIGFTYIIYCTITNPDISGGSTIMTISMLLSVYSIGLIFYRVRKSLMEKNAKKDNPDFDINKLFTEIPED